MTSTIAKQGTGPGISQFQGIRQRKQIFTKLVNEVESDIQILALLWQQLSRHHFERQQPAVGAQQGDNGVPEIRMG